MKKTIIEYVLVFIQFTTIGYLVLSSAWLMLPVWALIVTGLAGLLAIWAIGTMQMDNLKITPSPGETSRLITNGPYKLIRHPMYSSLLLLMFPLVIAEFSFLRLALGIALVIDLIFKLRYEERLLIQKFPQYAQYMQSTSRMIPYIY